MNDHPYADWRGVEQATKEAAKRTRATGRASSMPLDQQLLQALFDRFLCRVFSGADARHQWMLKGGTALLARVGNARSTRDVDLSSHAASVDEAVADLESRVRVDLGDHLRFELARSRPTGGGETQPHVEARSVTFIAWAGARKAGEVRVDVVVGHPPTGEPQAIEPAMRLHPARPLITVPYVVYPIADQVADKVCATMTPGFRDGMRSTRVKDLVDLVIIARTQVVGLRDLHLAIISERRRRRMRQFEALDVPPEWRVPYAKLSAGSEAAAVDFDSALHLMDQFLSPVLVETPLNLDPVWAEGQWADA